MVRSAACDVVMELGTREGSGQLAQHPGEPGAADAPPPDAPPPLAATLAALGVASATLRELLCDVLLLLPDEEAQDQVAAAAQGEVQRLLLAARLNALPPDLLAAVARKAGRPTRRAARLLRDAYGPLDCGLLLGRQAKDDADARLAADPHAFSRITALELTGFSHWDGDLEPGPQPAAFPQLAALSLLPHPRAVSDELTYLAPLAPSLTSLQLPLCGACDTAVAAVLQLTALRSLTMPFSGGYDLDGVYDGDAAAIHSLSSLRHLQRLEWLAGSVDDFPMNTREAASWLPCLRDLSGLTSLAMWPPVMGFDRASVDTLRAASPALAALTIIMYFDERPGAPLPDPASGAEVVAALAQRTALDSLHLGVSDSAEEPVDLAPLSLLRLSRFAVQPYSDALEAGAWRVAVGLQALTAFSLKGGFDRLYAEDFEPPSIGNSLQPLARRLRALRLARMCIAERELDNCAHELTLLTELRLVKVWLELGEGREVSFLRKLPNLEVLEFGLECSGVVRRGLMSAVGALCRLRELVVDFEDVPEPKQDEEDVRDADLWRALLPSSGTLTRLVLGQGESYWGPNPAWGVEGPGLAVVGRLTRLRELVLCKLNVLRNPALLEYLLPLPGSLRRLDVVGMDWMSPDTDVWAELQAAAAAQDCGASLEDW